MEVYIIWCFSSWSRGCYWPCPGILCSDRQSFGMNFLRRSFLDGRRVSIHMVLAVSLSTAVLWVGGCDEQGLDPSEILAQISLSVPNATLDVGLTLNIIATVLDGNGGQVDTATLGIRWTSSDESVAQVSSVGLVVGIARGTATITASVESLSASVVVNVVQVPATFVLLSAPAPKGPVGGPLDVGVRLVDSRGKGAPGFSILYGVLSGGGTSTPSEAVTDSDGASTTMWLLGTVAGMQQLEVRAVVGASSSGAAASAALEDAVFVLEAEAEPDSPSRLVLTPSDQTLTSGESGSVSGSVVDQFGNAVDDQPSFSISWSSSDPNVAAVEVSGAVTAAKVGRATITGRLDSDPGVTGSASGTVVPVPRPPPSGTTT